MKAAIEKIFQRKSEIVMLLAGISILVSVITVASTGSFAFWKITKFFYAIGVLLVLLDK